MRINVEFTGLADMVQFAKFVDNAVIPPDPPTKKDLADMDRLRSQISTLDRKSTRLNSSHIPLYRMPSSA